MITNTLDRLTKLVEMSVINRPDADAWQGSLPVFIQVLRMKLHHRQNETGPNSFESIPHQRVKNPLDERVLKESFRQAQRLQQKLELCIYQL